MNDNERRHMTEITLLAPSGQRANHVVIVDDEKLDPARSLAVFNHSPDGFSWGYGGSGPSQLALAILLAVTDDEELSVRLHHDFKADFVAGWEKDRSLVTSIDIAWWIDVQRTRRTLGLLRSWDTIEAYYAGNEQRRLSVERDYGVHWRSGNLGATCYRVVAVEDPGEIIAVRLVTGRRDEPVGQVFLIGRFPGGTRERVEAILDGWEHLERPSLAWALGRAVPTLAEAERRMVDPVYVPTLAEALSDPAAFVDGMTEVDS